MIFRGTRITVFVLGMLSVIVQAFAVRKDEQIIEDTVWQRCRQRCSASMRDMAGGKIIRETNITTAMCGYSGMVSFLFEGELYIENEEQSSTAAD